MPRTRSITWLGDHLRENARKEMGLHLFGSHVGGGYRSLANTDKEVRVPADLKGLKIRVTKSPGEFHLIKTWRDTPVPYRLGTTVCWLAESRRAGHLHAPPVDRATQVPRGHALRHRGGWRHGYP
jgi:hypothetical protein